MLRRTRSRARLGALPEISLTPLIDTALVLLVIFMVAAPVMHNSITVDLPRGSAQEALGVQQELVVGIDKSNILFLNGEQITHDDLLKALEKQVAHKQDSVVHIHADKDCSYGTCAHVIDSIKYLAGVEHVVLSTEKA